MFCLGYYFALANNGYVFELARELYNIKKIFVF